MTKYTLYMGAIICQMTTELDNISRKICGTLFMTHSVYLQNVGSGQWQRELVQTAQQHCLIWISLKTYDTQLI